MIAQPQVFGEYHLLFTEMNKAKERLEGTETGGTVHLLEIARIAEEIETLRAVTQQIADDTVAMRSVTLG